MINARIVISVVGVLLILFSTFMLLPLLWAITHSQPEAYSFLYSFLTTVAIGGLMYLFRPKKNSIRKREGFLIVSFGWLMMCLMGTLPYLFTSVTQGFTDAFFESSSGLTTTGASIFNDIEALPEPILLWRSLTQWIGGMGIIVLTVAILPLLGVSGIELFVAESPGPQSEKIHPRIKETAKRFWLIYLGLTIALCIILLSIGKMNFFDAMNHALTTLSTGGFSTKNASLAAYDAWAQYPIILFMFLAGMNYSLLYFGVKLNFKKWWANDEFKAYLALILTSTTIVGLVVYYTTNHGAEQAFRDAIFQVCSIITTTGFVSADYTSWTDASTLFFFFLLFTGACAGSTSGGIKVIRHFVFFKNSYLEFKRLLHPRAMIRTKINQIIVPQKIVTHILIFLWIYFFLVVFGSIIMGVVLTGVVEQPLLTSFGSVATCLGNVGPGIGNVGPVDNFANIPDFGKYFLSVLMVIGRLELFTVLIILTPYFWRDN